MHAKRASRLALRCKQMTLVLTRADVLHDESRKSEVVALLAKLLLEVAQVHASAEAPDDES